MYIIRVRKKDNHFVSSLSLSLPTSLYRSINYIQNFVFFYNHCCTLFINAVKRARKRREEREREESTVLEEMASNFSVRRGERFYSDRVYFVTFKVII